MKPVKKTLPLKTPHQIDCEVLSARIKQIDARRAEIEATLAHQPPESYARQELETEYRELASHRRVADIRLSDLRAPSPAPDTRREQFIANEVKIRRRQPEAFIQKLENEGDHRNARLWRMELLDLKQQVEKEYSA
jgi:hypothetical protein